MFFFQCGSGSRCRKSGMRRPQQESEQHNNHGTTTATTTTNQMHEKVNLHKLIKIILNHFFSFFSNALFYNVQQVKIFLSDNKSIILNF